jgi:integrase
VLDRVCPADGDSQRHTRGRFAGVLPVIDEDHLAAGVGVKQVQNQLGHASAQITLDV